MKRSRMTSGNKLGVALSLLGFVLVCIFALISTSSSPFAGMGGIQDDVRDRVAESSVVRTYAPESRVSAYGREVTLQLPDIANPGFDRQVMEQEILNIDGVRSVEILGNPMVLVDPDSADPLPTPEPDPEQTAPQDPTEPAEPEPDPTEPAEPEPDPTATSAPEPAEIAEPDANPADALNAILTGLAPIEFEPGTAVLTETDRSTLDQLAEALEDVAFPIEVQSHTNNVGDPDVNFLLTDDRANTIVEYLTERGVDAASLSARGFGASQPIADNSTEQGRIDNQRVAFVVGGN